MSSFEFGYYLQGRKVILGTVPVNQAEGKQKEINYANKIDPESKWFIQEVAE
jgi:hypothetical protein